MCYKMYDLRDEEIEKKKWKVSQSCVIPWTLSRWKCHLKRKHIRVHMPSKELVKHFHVIFVHKLLLYMINTPDKEVYSTLH